MRRRAVWLLLLLPLVVPAVALALATLTVEPDRIDFPALCLRRTSGSETVTITNEGNGDARDVVVVASPSELFPLGGATVVPTLTPGGESSFTVRFAPGRHGSQSGSVTITYDAARPSSSATPSPSPRTKTRSLPLTGEGIDRFVDTDPHAVNFGDVRVGRTASDTRTVTIYDDGDAPLTISSVTLGGEHPGDFSVGPRGPLTVRDGAPVRLRIGFRPEGVGARAADLVLRSDSCEDEVLTIDLAGIGVEPDVIAAPAELDFDEHPRRDTVTQGLTIINQGGWPLRVSRIALDGVDTDHFKILKIPTLPADLDPGESIDLRVRFLPREPGDRQALVRVESNDPDRRVLKVKLFGAVEEPPPTPTPTATPTITPTPTVEPEDPGSGRFFLAPYLAELGIAGGVVAFFGLLVLVRRHRGIPE